MPRERPHLYVYGTHGAPETVRAARALAERLADWGPGVAAHFVVKADVEVNDEDEARFELVLVGAAPLNAVAQTLRLPEDLKAAAADADGAYRLLAASPRGPDHRILIFGANTPSGFAKLGRFAVFNRDHWAPESNRALIVVH
jgi:hypothetical protein